MNSDTTGLDGVRPTSSEIVAETLAAQNAIGALERAQMHNHTTGIYFDLLDGRAPVAVPPALVRVFYTQLVAHYVARIRMLDDLLESRMTSPYKDNRP